MSDQQRDATARKAAQTGTGGGAPSEEIGHGPGLDPPAALPDDDADPNDEAYADRPATGEQTPPSQRPPKDGREPVGQSDYSDAAAIQRPPDDS